MRSNLARQLFCIFQLENILRSNFNFSTSYGRSTDLKSLLGLFLASFIWVREKNSLKYLLDGGFSPMSRRCRQRLCPNWLKTYKKSSFSANNLISNGFHEP